MLVEKTGKFRDLYVLCRSQNQMLCRILCAISTDFIRRNAQSNGNAGGKCHIKALHQILFEMVFLSSLVRASFLSKVDQCVTFHTILLFFLANLILESICLFSVFLLVTCWSITISIKLFGTSYYHYFGQEVIHFVQ